MQVELEPFNFGVLTRAVRELWDWLVAPSWIGQTAGMGTIGMSPFGQHVGFLNGSRRTVTSETVTITCDAAIPGESTERVAGASRIVTEQSKARKRLADCERVSSLETRGRVPISGVADGALVTSIGANGEVEREREEGSPQVLSWDPEEGMTYDRFMAAVHPKDRQAHLRRQREAIEDGIPIDLEYRIACPDGEERVVQERGRAELGNNGAPPRFSGTLRDVTEHRREQRDFERSEEKYRALLGSVPDAILVANAGTGDIVEANEAAGALFEMSVEELVGRNHSDLYPAEETENVETLFGWHETGTQNQTDPMHGPEEAQVYVETDSGEKVPVEVNASLVELDGERYFVGVYRDVSRRREVEERRDLLEQGAAQSDEMIVPETNGTIQSANRASEECNGSEPGELVEENPNLLESSLIPDARYDKLWSALTNGDMVRGTLTDRRKDGSPTEVEQTNAPLAHAEGEGADYASPGRDITDPEERKQELREREEMLRRQRNLLEQTQRLAGAWEVDLRTGEVSWSEEVYRIHELSPETEVEVEEAIEFFAPEVQPEIRAAFDDCVKRQEPFDLELPLRTARGNRRWVHVVGAPVKTNDGYVTKVAGAVQDLTQRRVAEEALQEREARLRGLANSIPGVVYQFYARPDGTYGHHFVSEHAEDLLGLSAETEGFHERVVARIPTEYREDLAQSIERAIAEEESWRFECPFEKPSGEEIWIRGLSSPERRDGEIVFTGVILDVTDRKKAEQALQEERDRFATLFDSLPTPVIRGTVRSDEEGAIVASDINSAFEEVFGYEAEEVEGEVLRDLIVPNDRQDEAVELNREVKEEETLQTEVERLAADGLRSFHLQAATRERSDEPTEAYAIYSDITERKRIERELRARERWIRSITENASGGIFRRTSDGIEYVNEAFLSMFGYDRLEDLRGADVTDLFARPDERERFGRLLEEQGEFPCIEVELQRNDGSTFMGMLSGTVVRDADGRPEYYDGVVTDITDEHRRRTRRQRQQNALSDLMAEDAVVSGRFDEATRIITERVAEVLDVGHVNVWLLDEDGETLRCTDHYDRAQGLHANGSELSAEAYPAYFEALASNRVNDIVDVCSDPRTAKMSDGHLEEETVGALLDATLRSEGEVVGVVCHAHVGGPREWTDDEIQFAGEVADVVHRALRNREQTERRQKIAFQQSLLKAQQEAVLDGVLVIDKDGEVVSCNDRFAELWDLPDELLERGQDSEKIFARVIDQAGHPEEFRKAVARLNAHPSETSRTEMECSDGRVLDRYSTPLVEQDGTHYGRLWTFRDITAQKAREHELEAAKQHAEEASQLKTAMLANMSHEIRTPLTTIIGYSEMLKEELDGQLAGFAKKAHGSGHRLMRTLNSVLQLSKLEAGVHELERERVRLTAIAREAVETFQREAEEESIALSADLPEAPVEGSWNEAALTQILENLLENAIKFTPDDGHVEVRVEAAPDAATLVVEDDGIGMGETFQTNVFRAFKQESEGLSREYEGAGLGLSIVWRLVEALEGQVRIDSEKGEGTCVVVRLPRWEAAAEHS